MDPYLALAALNRVVAPTSKLRFADWWQTIAADRFTKIPASVLDHRKFWEAMHALALEELAEVQERIAVAMVSEFNLDISALALDMTNFATYIDSVNEKAPIAQRGKTKQKRTVPSLVGLGLVITRGGGNPAAGPRLPREQARRHRIAGHDRCTRRPAPHARQNGREDRGTGGDGGL